MSATKTLKFPCLLPTDMMQYVMDQVVKFRMTSLESIISMEILIRHN